MQGAEAAEASDAGVVVIPRLRRFYWQRIRRYEFEVCGECGKPASLALGDTYWTAPNSLWNEVHGSPNGIRCPRCFTKAAAEQGRHVAWLGALIDDVDTAARWADRCRDHVPGPWRARLGRDGAPVVGWSEQRCRCCNERLRTHVAPGAIGLPPVSVDP